MLIRKYPEFQSTPATNKKWDTVPDVAKHIAPGDAATLNQQDSVVLNRSRQPHFAGPAGGQATFVKATKEGDIKAFHTAYWDSDIFEQFYYTHMNPYYPTRREMAGYHEGGSTLMHLAARYGHVDIMRWLESNTPSSPTRLSKDNSRITPMHEAAANNQTQVLQYLHETKSIPLESQDALGRTPLYHAVMNNHVQSAQYLVRNGALISNKILEMARKNNYTQILNLLEYAPKEQLREPVQKSGMLGFLSSSSTSLPSGNTKELEKVKNENASLKNQADQNWKKYKYYKQQTKDMGGDVSSSDESDSGSKPLMRLFKKKSVSKEAQAAHLKRQYKNIRKAMREQNIDVSSSSDEEIPKRGRSKKQEKDTKDLKKYERTPSPRTREWVLLYFLKNNFKIPSLIENKRDPSVSSAHSTSSIMDRVYNFVSRSRRPSSQLSDGSDSGNTWKHQAKNLKNIQNILGFIEEEHRQTIRELKATKKKEMLLSAGMFATGLTGIAIGIPLVIFVPPVGAAFLAAGGTISVSALTPVVKKLGGLMLDLAKNDEFLPATKHKMKLWAKSFKDALPKLPQDPDKRTQELIERQHQAADELDRNIEAAQSPLDCKRAIETFLATVGKNSMDHVKNHGTPQQKEDLEILQTFGNEFKNLTVNTLGTKPTDDDIDRYGQELQKLLLKLEGMPDYQKLVERLRTKDLSELTPKKMGLMSLSELFGDDLKSSDFRQRSGHTCYLLAPLDNILRHSEAEARNILNRIRIERVKGGGYKVKFPGCEAISVSQQDLKSLTSVESEHPGPRIIEQAYLNLLKKKKMDPTEFNDPTTALFQIFFGDTQPDYAHITVQARDWRDAAPIEASFFNGAFCFWEDLEKQKLRVLTPEMMIPKDQSKLLEKVRDVQGQPHHGKPIPVLHLERPEGFKVGGKEAIRYKLAEQDQRIGEQGFFYHQRKAKLQAYIQDVNQRGKQGQADFIDILTAVRYDPKTDDPKLKNGRDNPHFNPKAIKHYYSVRILESTPDEIVLIDPRDTTGQGLNYPAQRINIDTFLQNFNLEGVRLNKISAQDNSWGITSIFSKWK